MTTRFQHIGIVGAGAWGRALALAAQRAGRDVTLWSHGEHAPSVPGIQATTNLAGLTACHALIMACPAQVLREVAERLTPHGGKHAPLLIAAKGIELTTASLLSDIIAAELPGHAIAVLSGPSFASEVAQALPTALTLAMQDRREGEALASALASPAFRLYVTDDIIGAQIGGALKNVLAIACGIVTGRQMGDNARAALMTRGLAEMIRLAVSAGGKAETLMGLSGLGDLALTCSSPQSRNMSLGIALGQGRKLADILAESAGVTEGVATAAAALSLARKQGVDMPIVTAVDAVLNHRADIDATITGLLARPLRNEM